MSLEEKIAKLKSQLSPEKQQLLEKRLRVAKSSSAGDPPDLQPEIVTKLNLSVSKNWILDEHRIMGKATLPGTAYLEIARAACENYFPNCVISLKEVYFFMPLIVEDWEEKEVRTILKKQRYGFDFLIVSQSNLDSGSWIEYVKGKITCEELSPPIKHEISQIESNLNQDNIVIAQKTFQSEMMEWGARWSNCKWIKLGTNQGLARLELPEEFSDDCKSYKLHPALLDSATGFLTMKFQEAGSFLPFSYKSLKIKGNLPSKLYSYIKVIGNNQSLTETLTFNVTIMDDQGTELVEIEEYTLRKFRTQQLFL